MKLLHYSLVRFVSDPVRGDGLNVGVIVIDDEQKDGVSAFLKRFKVRLNLFDPWADADVVTRLLDSLAARVGSHQAKFAAQDARIASASALEALFDSMKNQLQVTRPRAYRSASLKAAADELYSELVSPRHRPPSSEHGMSLSALRKLIRATIRDWGGEVIKIEEETVAQGSKAKHYADFWLQAGSPIAALIAIPDDPDERDVAWARRDSVPTIAAEFLSVNPDFKAVVVFPPNGRVPARDFVVETTGFLQGKQGIIVTHADELSSQRDLIAPRLL